MPMYRIDYDDGAASEKIEAIDDAAAMEHARDRMEDEERTDAAIYRLAGERGAEDYIGEVFPDDDA